MDDREKTVIEAAIGVFVRYGVKRTTMHDIASEAGIARQTLYNLYANKDEVVRAAIRWHTNQSLAAIEAECATAATLADKLDRVFEHMVVAPFDLLHASPHADDIITGFNDAARAEILAAGERYRLAIERALAPCETRLRSAGLGAHELSDLIQVSGFAFKHEARNRQHLLDLLASLKGLVLSVAGDTRGGSARLGHDDSPKA